MSRRGSRTCSVLLLLLFFLISLFADAGTRMGGSYIYTNTYILYIMLCTHSVILYTYIIVLDAHAYAFDRVSHTTAVRRRALTYNNIRQVVFINIRYFLFFFFFLLFYLSHTRSLPSCACVCVKRLLAYTILYTKTDGESSSCGR